MVLELPHRDRNQRLEQCNAIINLSDEIDNFYAKLIMKARFYLSDDVNEQNNRSGEEGILDTFDKHRYMQ